MQGHSRDLLINDPSEGGEESGGHSPQSCCGCSPPVAIGVSVLIGAILVSLAITLPIEFRYRTESKAASGLTVVNPATGSQDDAGHVKIQFNASAAYLANGASFAWTFSDTTTTFYGISVNRIFSNATVFPVSAQVTVTSPGHRRVRANGQVKGYYRLNNRTRQHSYNGVFGCTANTVSFVHGAAHAGLAESDMVSAVPLDTAGNADPSQLSGQPGI